MLKVSLGPILSTWQCKCVINTARVTVYLIRKGRGQTLEEPRVAMQCRYLSLGNVVTVALLPSRPVVFSLFSKKQVYARLSPHII
jgi:hypothetical protein